MKSSKLVFFLFLSIFSTLFFLFLIFLWWNNTPSLPQRSNPPIRVLNVNRNIKKTRSSQILKIASYNIHFGVGFDAQTLNIDKNSYEKRLDKIAQILKNIDADIVLLQEVDSNSRRSNFIDQGTYLATQAGYRYLATAPTLRGKIHINFHKIIGKIEHGLTILSKFPIEYNESFIFNHSNELPFFVKWLYDPHGAQKCSINYYGKKINVINLHLDPWSQIVREDQIEKIKNIWLTKTNLPTIIGGDFNSISPRALKKDGQYLNDAPWFIDRKKWDIKNESTILTLMHLDFKEAAPFKLSLKHRKYYTYPSNDPKEKIDHIFAGYKARVIQGYIYEEAKIASDHLPIVADIKINSN